MISFKFIFLTSLLCFNSNCVTSTKDAGVVDSATEKSGYEDTVVSAHEKTSNRNLEKRIQETDKSNILDYLPENYSKIGDKDYTAFLQKAVEENKVVVLPDFPIAVNYNGISVPSNRKIEFQKNSKLTMIANDKKRYQVILLSGVEDVEIVNSNIVGDRKKHKASDGEWGMGISIISSRNIRIENCNISECWGDGIYIARDGNAQNIPSNITIDGGTLDNNRRNGISVISGTDLKILNLNVKNINGVLPMAGIDIEPNNNLDRIGNLIIENVNTSNCNIGIQVGIRNLPSEAEQEVKITVKNIKSSGDNHGVLMGDLFRKNKYPLGTRKLSGKIQFENLQIDNSKKEPIKYFSQYGYEFAPQVIFSNILIDKKQMNSSLKKEIKARSFNILD